MVVAPWCGGLHGLWLEVGVVGVRAGRAGLVAARQAAGHTQESLAEALKVDRSTVVRWESGERTPQPHVRPKLAGLLGQTPGAFALLLDDHLAFAEPAPVLPPSAAVEWLGVRAGWSEDNVREHLRDARSVLAGQEAQRPAGRESAPRSAVAARLQEFYGLPAVESDVVGFAATCGGHPLRTSVVVRPGWTEGDRPLRDASTSVRSGMGSAPFDEVTARAALSRLVRSESHGQRLFDAPVYRLRDMDVREGRPVAAFDIASFLDYACTSDLMEAELHTAIRSGSRGRLPLRERWMPDLDAVFEPSSRVCAGGVLALCAIARPPERGRSADYAILLQRRSEKVLNAAGRRAVLPKAFHQPLTDPARDVALEATLLREMEEELFGRAEVDNTVTPGRIAAPMHPSRLSEPMRWLLASDSFRMESTGAGFNLVSGNYEFAALVLIDDEEFWERFGGHIEANWEASSVELVSSGDREALAEIARDETWSDEGLFAYLLGLRRLREIGGDRVDVPPIEVL